MSKLFNDLKKRGTGAPTATGPAGVTPKGSKLFSDLSNNAAYQFDTTFTKGQPVELTGQTGVGESMFDDNIPYSELDNLNEIRSQRQPWLAKTGAGLSRVGTKVLAEIAKMPGVLGGVVAGGIGQIADGVTGEDNTDFMQIAFNNAWVKGIEDAEEYVNSEVLPVYVSKAVSDGKLWDKITSMDFWATEGADGLGYVISMLAPGQAISSLKLGSKLTGVGKWAKMAGSVEKATARMTQYGFTPKNMDIGLAGLANTLFEAGAEARGAMDGYRSALEQRLALPQGHPEYLSQTDFDDLIERESAIGANVFNSNAAILLVPNMIMAKMLWGKPRNKTPLKGTTGASDAAIPRPSLAKRIGNWGDQFGRATLREGFWEEGMQSTVEKYFVDNPGANILDFWESPTSHYIKNLGTTDGQTAIFLGAIYGGTMQATINSYKTKSEREQTNKLMGQGSSVIEDYARMLTQEDVWQKDEAGEDIYKNNAEGVPKRQIDPFKLQMKLRGVDALDKLSAIYDIALETGNVDMQEDVEQRMYTDLVKPFIVNDNLGIEALRNAVKANKAIAEATKDANLDPETVVKDIVKKAEYLKKKYNSFQAFAPTLIKLNNAKATPQDKQNFMNILTSKYLNTHSRKQFLEEKKAEKEELLRDVLAERGYTVEDLSEDNALKRRDVLQSSRVAKLYAELQNIDQSLEEATHTIEEFWDKKTHTKDFNAFVKEARDLEAKLAKEKEVSDKIAEIQSAGNIEELEKIALMEGDEETNEILQGAIEKRKLEIEQAEKQAIINAKAAEENKLTKKEKDKLEKEERIQYLKDNFSVGEIITTPEFVKDHGGETVTITKINKHSISVKNEETGENFTISLASIAKNEAVMTDLTNVEGNIGTYEISEETRAANAAHDHNVEDRTDSVVMTTDASEAHTLFPGIDPAALEWERNPVNKTDKIVRFEIDKKEDKSRQRQVSELWAQIRKNNAEVEGLTDAALTKEYKSLNRRLKLSKKEATIKKLNRLLDKVKYDINLLSTLAERTDPIKDQIESIKKDIEENPAKLSDVQYTDNQEKALAMALAQDYSDLEFLINYLPLSTKFTSTVSAPLHTRSDTPGAGKFNAIWEKTTKNLRTAIIKEMAIEGTPINKISVEIAGQKNGEVTMSPKIDGKVQENFVHNLHEFAGDINNVKTSDIFVVNKLGFLENNSRKPVKVHLNRPVAPGEIYIRIKTANGSPFYLKLNIRKTTQDEASLLYEIYKYRFEEEHANKLIPISETTPELYAEMQEKFAEPLKLIGKPIEDITIKDVVDFFIYDGSKSRKSQVRFYTKLRNEDDTDKTRLLLVGNEEFSKEEFLDEKGKAAFMYTLTEMKRHNIRFKKPKSGPNSADKYLMTLRNKSYLQYLLRNKILNTNAVVNEPTFQGATNVYLKTFRVKVNNKLSKHNVGTAKTYSKRLRGKNAILNKYFPKLKQNHTRLAGNQKGYVDSNGDFYYRVSTLKGKGKLSTTNMKNAAKRGNVVDELVRAFFSYPVNRNVFLQMGKDTTAKQNKRGEGTPISFEDGFFDQLYNILDQYAAAFEEKNYTIYANIPSVAGSLGNTKYDKFGGTVDLLAYDHDQGHYVLIDLKTTSSERSGYYNSKKDPYGYKSGDRIQLNAYRELLKQKTGIEVEEIFIMPLTAKSLDKENSMYRDISIDADGMFIEVEKKSIYDMYKPSKTKKGKSGRFIIDDLVDDGGFSTEGMSDEEIEKNAWDPNALIDVAKAIGKLLGKTPTPKKADSKTPTEEKSSKQGEAKIAKIIDRFTKTDDASIINTAGKTYAIATDVGYIVELEAGGKKIKRIVVNKAEAIGAVRAWNVKYPSGFTVIGEKLFMDKYEAVFFSKTDSIETKVAEATKDTKIETKSTGIDLSKVPDADLDKINQVLAGFITRDKQKGFQTLMSKNINKPLREKVELLANFLIDRQVSVEEIRKKCGI